MATAPKRLQATIAEALARPESDRAELIRGSLVQKAAPTPRHSAAQLGVSIGVGSRFNRRPGGRWPGGWWIRPEVDIQLGRELFRPDLVGWRRDRCPDPPEERPVKLRPDWVCEILSPSNAAVDRVQKMQSFFQAGVPHYWLLNPTEFTLEVYRHAEEGYLLALSAQAGQTVRAEPFEAVELKVDELFGADPEDE
jgi:Uma2 family endonuclease